MFFLLVGLAIFSGGIARVGCAFARNCYLRADAQGMALRLPELGWFGRYRMRELSLPWRDVAQLIDFTSRVSGIATSRKLRVRLRNGSTIKLPRYFFAQPISFIEDRLRELMPRSAR